MRPGIRLGIDVGAVRIGVARTDSVPIMSFPVTTITADESQFDEIAKLVQEYNPIEIVVGIPTLLSGKEGSAVAYVQAWCAHLRAKVPAFPIRLVDERLTTTSAHQALREAGISSKKHRPKIDQQAAVLILEQALAMEKQLGESYARYFEDENE